CECNDDCSSDSVCVDGSEGRRVCCPEGIEGCPSDPGPGIVCEPPDAAVPDTGPPDAALPDAALPDAARPDVGRPDSSPLRDAATTGGDEGGNRLQHVGCRREYFRHLSPLPRAGRSRGAPAAQPRLTRSQE
ncbi:MAG: hypothetical protein AAGE52_32310, partial [Myxococcota bacterium]